MLTIIGTAIVSACLGFAAGRIKNAAKLAEVKGLLAGLEHGCAQEIGKIVAEVRAKL